MNFVVWRYLVILTSGECEIMQFPYLIGDESEDTAYVINSFEQFDCEFEGNKWEATDGVKLEERIN